ncbi:hypothetical protein KSD_10010 [Ktedonobacter sp. SOSP1-85]|uniref:tetratricopeptide repeat protein n=1 Tax=Ktedonobacter sp. SOSP1-85 TaxID=2778367 RepID=UPI00191531D8|nr:tetratricopeptide repeat protein [Ktedonobacter sp. SOSP1-85]GHO73230.1 hypothetical protein KSD_10010 [Ktedonobacter sp. SOSP1-85]
MAQTKLQTNPPTTLRDYLQQTEDLISRGEHEEALARCQQILAQHPESLEAQRLLGEVYFAQGKLEEAQQAFDWVLMNDPENVVVYCDRALISESLSDFDTALDCYQQAYELSRGNSHIREEFNKLSARAGQQGFMFSRAGLARLYTRGDLVTQAIQEWEAVLAVTPERLDARLGLLEALWREGLYDRTEQLARQILQDVPGCLKAQLLLAHIISPRDLHQAEDLIKRAEALDPDLLMAQELFADLLAKQTPAHEPFLALIQRDPVALDKFVQEVSAPQPSTSSSRPSWPGLDAVPQEAQKPSTSSSRPSWPGFDSTSQEVQQSSTSSSRPSWPGFDAIPEQQQSSTSSSRPSWPGFGAESQEAQQAPASEASMPGAEAPAGSSSTWDWPGVDQPATATTNQSNQTDLSALLAEARKYLSSSFEDEASSPAAEPEQPSKQPSSASWSGISSEPSASEPATTAPNKPSSGVWEASTTLNKGEATPTEWLDMLTQGERQRMAEPAGEPQEVSAPVESQQPPTPVQPSQPAVASQPLVTPEVKAEAKANEDAFTSPFAMDDDEEESSFGPSWLKSIGAESRENSMEMPAISLSKARPEASKPVAKSEAPVSPQPAEQPKPSVELPTASEPIQPAPEPGSADPFASWPGYAATPSAHLEQPEVHHEAPQEEAASLPTFDSWNFSSDMGGEPGASAAMPEWASQLLGSSGTAPAEPLPAPSWMSQLSRSAEPAPLNEAPEPAQAEAPGTNENEQSVVSSLEDLEKNLYSQGFVPMEPHSLSSLAETEPATPEQPEQPEFSEIPDYLGALKQEPQGATPDFLRELQGWQQQPSQPEAQDWQQQLQPSQPEAQDWQQQLQPSQSEAQDWQQQLQPSLPEAQDWQQQLQPSQSESQESTSLSSALAQLGLVSQRAQEEPQAPVQPAASVAPESQPSAEQPSWVAALGAVPPMPVQPVTREPEPQSAPVQPTTPFAVSPKPDVEKPSPQSKARPNPFLEDGLETTMKRPAIRLQPMQRNAKESQAPVVRSRPVERQSAASEGSGKPQERLLKGYQYQLVGDYDEAMQEYRVLVRTSPEVLGEVVSNLRALLKLAPNYAAGYRVLGDAYMRQGEYLQAMEAYNKALTMAKKAKS